MAHKELPNVVVNFMELNTTEQMEGLRLGRIDIGILRPGLTEPGIASACIERGDLALAVARHHPLALRRQLVMLKQLDDVPFIMYSKIGRYFQNLLMAMFEQAQVQPRYVQFMDQTHAILSLVSAGMGVAIVPVDARSACFDNVVFKPLNTQIRSEIHGAWRADDRDPAILAIRDMILRHSLGR